MAKKIKKEKDQFTRKWIIKNSLEEIQNYRKGALTIRALHYRMVARGMTNTIQHYKRVVSAMIVARWDNLVDFDTFSDFERETLGKTDYLETSVESETEEAKSTIEFWMDYYRKNRWENQDTYIEVWIEKKALIGIFQPICDRYNVSLSPCKGYPSLTFLNDAANRFREAQRTHNIKILYFGDYDPSGEDIPRSLKENLSKMGVDVEVDRRLLLKEDVIAMNLPAAPTKLTDSRSANWDGLGQVELDAVEANELQKIIKDAILEHRDQDKYDQLIADEEIETEEYKNILKEFIKTL